MASMEIARYEQRKALLTESARGEIRSPSTLSSTCEPPQLREWGLRVNDPTQLGFAALIQNLPSPPLSNIISMARTTTERHGSNYSGRHGNALCRQGEVSESGQEKKALPPC